MIRITTASQFGRHGAIFSSSPAGSAVRSRLTSSMRVEDGDDRATAAALSRGGRSLADAAARTGLSSIEAGGSNGLLPQMLRSIGNIANRMRAIKTALKESTAGSEQQAALSQELNDLGAEYERIVGGESFERMTDYLRQIAGTLQRNGSAGDGLYQSLAGGRAFFGEAFLASVQSGELFKIGALGQSLSQLEGIDAEGLADDDLLTRVTEAVTSALGALTGTLLPEAAADPAAVPVVQSPQETILPTQVTYVGAEKVALSLRSYSAEDMIKLAAAHADLDPAAAIMLVPNPPPRGRKKEDEWLEERPRTQPDWRAAAREREEERVEKMESAPAGESPDAEK